MKQPELGKRILELRKQKGFTQEELVEQCNINVRTIQRIEAGDVTPRSFTIKTILEVLEVDTNVFFKDQNSNVEFSNSDIRNLRISWIAAIFFSVVTAISMVFEISYISRGGSLKTSNSEELMYRIIFGVLSLTALLFFLRGYKILGDRFKNKTLISATYIYYVIEVIMIGVTVMITIINPDENIAEILTGMVLILSLGVVELILGIGIQKLKDQLGSFAQTVGLLKIVNGALLLTVILSPISFFIAIPILIIETIFLYKTTEKISVK